MRKKIFSLPSLIIFVAVSFLFVLLKTSCTRIQQPTNLFEIRTDTLKVYNPHGGGAELMLKNSTKKVINGVLTNIDTNGLTQFRTLDLIPVSGGNITGKTNIIVGTDGYRLGIMKSAGTAQTGNGTLGAPSTYLQLGGGEWNVSSYRMIGLGYLASLTDNAPAQMGYQETVKTGSTYGDLVFATRSVTTNTAPIIRFRITAAGNAKAYGPVTAPEDVATKGYVDTAYTPIKTITFTGTYSLNGTPSNTFVANNANSANTITLPTAKDGITYTIWKIGGSVMTLTGAIVDAGKTGTKVVSGADAGSTITLICRNGSWVITAKNGTWTTQ
jgi:hypothetical protein